MSKQSFDRPAHRPSVADGSPDIPAHPELLLQVRTGLQLVERQRELVEGQLAAQRYYRDALAEYVASISAAIAALEQRQAQLASLTAELRRAERRLDS